MQIILIGYNYVNFIMCVKDNIKIIRQTTLNHQWRAMIKDSGKLTGSIEIVVVATARGVQQSIAFYKIITLAQLCSPSNCFTNIN